MNEQILEVATVPQQTADSFLALVERAARDPSVDVSKMERLLEMAEKVHARQAESQYNEAMNAAQGEMRPVARDCNNPQTHSRYASYGALDNALRPVYSAHGFSLSFGTKAAGPDSVTITCRVSHRAGHTEKVEIEMPADGKGAKGGDVMTKTHATGSAVSYVMRYLLKMIFNVSVGEYDDDGNAASPQRSKTPQDASRTPPPRTPVPAKKATATPQGAAAAPVTVKKADAKFDVAAFLANCRNRLLALVAPDDEWAWWKYAQDKSWIMPNESLAAATADKMFEGYDPKDIQKSVRDIFDAHCTAVNAMAANCPPEFREEILRGFVPMTKTAAPPKTAAAPKADGCPVCLSTATKHHDDVDGAKWCQKCGAMWDVGTGDVFEEHGFMEARLPFAPKDAAKKDYKGKTLGQISRLDNKYWYGCVMNFKAEPFKGRPPSEASVKFGEACEAAREHLEEAKETRIGPEPPTLQEEQDDVPF